MKDMEKELHEHHHHEEECECGCGCGRSGLPAVPGSGPAPYGSAGCSGQSADKYRDTGLSFHLLPATL